MSRFARLFLQKMVNLLFFADKVSVCGANGAAGAGLFDDSCRFSLGEADAEFIPWGEG